jgi:nitrate/nitrite transporter NarK
VYPVMIALTGRYFPGAGTALGLVAGAGACGGFVLPWISGVVGDAFDARYAIAVLGASAAVIAVGALVLGRERSAP